MAIRFGRYETLEALAVGGMAKVYRGRARGEAGFERAVAIKVMHSHIAADPEFVNMFLDEARVAARISHPNVVATHDVQRSPAGIFLVMDFVDGVDLALLLRALRKDQQRIELPVVCRIMLETLKGLQAAHDLRGADGESLELVHRDVSPQNILLDKTGFVKITDFGVAHATERLATTRGGELKGKMGYLSPEHVREGQVDARSDVYAAGVVLWEMLTAKRLFKADERVSVLADIMAGNIPSPKEERRNLQDEIVQVCLKALALEPSQRYESASEFAAALRAAAAQANVGLAEAEDIARLIRNSGVLELAAANRQQLNRDESTQEDLTVLDSLPEAPRKRSRRSATPVWLAFALGASLGLAGLLYFVLTQSPRPLPAGAMDNADTQLDITAMPAIDEPIGDMIEESKQDGDTTDDEQESVQRKRRPSPAPSSSMYHPSGL